MEIAANALFTYDHANRMLRVNEPDGAVAPRFFLGRTRESNTWRVRHDLPAKIIQQLESVCLQEPIAADLRERPAHFEALRAILEVHSPIQDIYIGPEYYFPAAIAPTRIARRMTPDDADYLRPHFPYSISMLHAGPPVCAVIADGQAVSVCFSSRTTPLADEAGIYTVAEYRGKGYAPAAVAAWALAIRAAGRIPLYGTTWDNLASQNVAGKLGLVMFGESLSVS